MAKQVSNIFINLGIKNAEGLDKLKGAFRELDKAVGPTSRSIDSAIAAVKRFSDSSDRSEQLIRGQIDAFKGLRSQVDVGGKRYAALTNEIGKLQAELRGSTDALERQREKLLRTASAGNQNAKSLQNQIASLERLRQQTRPGSSAFIQLGKDIDAATVSLGKFKSIASQAAQVSTQAIGASFEKAGKQVQALQADLQTLNFSSAEFLKRQKEINQILNQQASSVGRQNVRANAAIYTNPEYLKYMERRGRNLPLPATPAGYQQRIGEINTELENISSLERRRELTLELDKLNRQLKGTIIDATSAEQRAVDVVRARVNAQREALSQSGFGAFSASVTGRNFKAEQQQQSVANVKAAFAAIEIAYESMSIAVQSAEQRTLQQELNAAQLIEEGDQRAHAATMQRKQQEADAGERWFRQELARLDILAQQRKAAASALGLGGRDLSPLYERITGLATAGVNQQQQFMGRNATQVYNDIATAFNKGGRPVDIKEKSTYIGDSIAQGVSEGANASSSITSGAKGFADKLIGAYKTAFGIKSPSRESKQKIGVPIGQGIGEGIIEGVNSLKTQIQLAIKGAVSTPGKAPLPGAMGPLSSTAERLQAFVVQSAANAPSARRYSRLLGEGITSSGTIPLAMYRRAYERGELMPEVFGSLSERRLGRQYAIPGTPGYGLERMLQAEATRAVGRTGAFVSPLSGGLTRAGAFGALPAPRIAGGLSPVGAAPLPIFATSRSLAALQGSLPGMAYGMGGSAFPLAGPLERTPVSTRSAASASLRESIGTYRKAVDNFWEGETNTFTTLRRIISSNVQVGASRLARSLTETRSSLSTLTTETAKATGLPAEVFGRIRAEIRAARQQVAVQQGASGLQKLGASPVEGMLGPSSPIDGGPRPPTSPPPAGPSGAGGGFTQLNAELTKFGALNRRSISDLQNLKGVLADVHSGLSPLAADYRKVNSAIERQNTLLDKELTKRQLGGGGRRLGGAQLAQIAGASISGGIFGGPEGLIGGIAGGIFGGVGGSFAGSAAGAQLGMIRQQLGGTAEYAAQIGKLQIALRGVAGSQSNYTQALSAAEAATRDLNIPQMEATQGITRLSAAVLGAGGTMGDATFAFRAISESIKATGGNAEQVDGALLALTQVFSKGKVSAEELNQIAERLPGTFTLFAQAAGKSGPELQKALEQGEVGLNDLMKFLEVASQKNAETAQNIAGSSEEAGARMKIAFDQMRLDIGKALQPIGAELQNTFAVFVKEITPAVIGAAQGIGGVLKTLLDNAKAIEIITKLGLAFVGANLAIKAFVTLQGPLAIASLAIKAFFGNVSTQAAMAKQQIKSFAASIAAPLVISLAIVGIDGVLSSLREVEEARKRAEGAGKASQGDEFVTQAGGASLNTRDLGRLLRENAVETNRVQDALKRAREEASGIGQGFLGINTSAITLADAREILKESRMYSPRDVKVASQLVEYETKLATLQSRREAIQRLMRTAKPPATLPNAPVDDKDKKSKEEKDAEQLAETERRLAQEGIKLQMDGQLKAFEYAVELDRRRYDLQKQLQDEATANQIEALQGGARTVAQAFANYRSRIAEIDRDVLTAKQNTSIERERLRTSQVVEGVVAGGSGNTQGRYIQGGIGPRGANTYGPHFDIKRSDGSYYERNALDQYVKVNGLPLSRGTTVPGGRFGAPRDYGGHAGWDYAFGAGAALTLTGGAKWIGSKSGSYGDAAAFMTPDGKVYKILHGKFEPAAAVAPSAAPTAAEPGTTGRSRSQLLRQQKVEAKADFATQDLNKTEAMQKLQENTAPGLKKQAEIALTLELTKAYSSARYELQLTYDLDLKRAELQRSGASTAEIDKELKLYELRRRNAEEIKRIELEISDPGERQKQLDAVNQGLRDQVDLMQKIYDLNEATANSVGFREGAQRYVESIGTLREATSGLAQQGFKGIEDSIVSLATTGTANFTQFATSLLNDMARIIIQQLVVKQLAQAISSLFGGPSPASTNPSGFNWDLINKYSSADGNVFGANGIVPYAKGGVVTRPMLFPFANGGAIGTGLMGEAGPEAIMPLQRGPNGKLGVVAVGGGTTNVVVNVDASGNSSVQGRDDRASQLGRVISQAVQAELIKQRRPGGILA